MRRKHKRMNNMINGGSNEARTVKYWVRAIKRFIVLLFWALLLFLIIMGIVYIVPKIWSFALS